MKLKKLLQLTVAIMVASLSFSINDKAYAQENTPPPEINTAAETSEAQGRTAVEIFGPVENFVEIRSDINPVYLKQVQAAVESGEFVAGNTFYAKEKCGFELTSNGFRDIGTGIEYDSNGIKITKIEQPVLVVDIPLMLHPPTVRMIALADVRFSPIDIEGIVEQVVVDLRLRGPSTEIAPSK